MADDCWERRPQLILALELHRAECEFLTGALATAEARLTMLSVRAANAIDQATVACLRVDLYTTLDRSDRAVDVCLAYLRHLGIELVAASTERTSATRIRAYLVTARKPHDSQEFVDLPLMSDALSLATQDVLTKVVPPALFTDRNLLSLVICRMVNLSLEYGNSDGSCFAYVFLGMIADPTSIITRVVSSSAGSGMRWSKSAACIVIGLEHTWLSAVSLSHGRGTFGRVVIWYVAHSMSRIELATSRSGHIAATT